MKESEKSKNDTALYAGNGNSHQAPNGVYFKGEVFSGPLPHPLLLAEYDKIVPGAANRILSMAETQSAHRQSLESQVIESGVRQSNKGQNFGFVIAIVFLLAAVFLVRSDHEIAGTILGSIDIVGLVAVFVYGKREQRLERIEKERTMQNNVGN